MTRRRLQIALVVCLGVLPACFGPARPRLVDHPQLGRALLFYEKEFPEALQLSPSGKLLLLSFRGDGFGARLRVTRMISVRSGKVLWDDDSYWTTLDRQDKYVAMGAKWLGRERIEVRRAALHSRLHRLEAGHSPPVFIGSDRLLVERAGALAVIHVPTGKALRTVSTQGDLWHKAAAADGSLLAYGGDREVKALELATGRTLCVLAVNYVMGNAGGGGHGIQLSDDGRLMSVGTNGHTFLLETRACRLLAVSTNDLTLVTATRPLWIARRGSSERGGKLVSFDPSTLTWVAQLPLADYPIYFGLARDGTLALVARRDYDTLIWFSSGRALLGPAQPSASEPTAERVRFRWIDTDRGSPEPVDHPPWAGRVLTYRDNEVELRVEPAHSGFAFTLRNRSAALLHVDWNRTWLADGRGARLLARLLGQYGYKKGLPHPAWGSTAVPAGAAVAQQLVTERLIKGNEVLMDPIPLCASKLVLHLGLTLAGGRPVVREVPLDFPCHEDRQW